MAKTPPRRHPHDCPMTSRCLAFAPACPRGSADFEIGLVQQIAHPGCSSLTVLVPFCRLPDWNLAASESRPRTSSAPCRHAWSVSSAPHHWRLPVALLRISLDGGSIPGAALMTRLACSRICAKERGHIRRLRLYQLGSWCLGVWSDFPWCRPSFAQQLAGSAEPAALFTHATCPAHLATVLATAFSII